MAFPQTPLDVRTELQIAGAWVDVSGDTYEGEPITISRGRHDEAGEEVYHHDAIFFMQSFEHVVRHISTAVGHRLRRGMRKNYRGFRGINRIVHGLCRHVRDIHHHSQVVHFLHDFFAEWREPITFRCVGR